MATVALYDHNLSGPVVYLTGNDAESEREYLADHVGTWFYPTSDGALIIGDEWSAAYFHSDMEDVTDVYPDYILSNDGAEVA